MIVRRIFVSSPRDEWLDERGKALKHGILEEIRFAGYEPQYFDLTATGDLVAGRVWNFDNADEVMRRCVGVAIIGLARWAFAQREREIVLASEYCHYEGSLARARALPILATAETDLSRRGIFVPYGLPVLPIPPGADATWVKGPEFTGFFAGWMRLLRARRDVFLGYCSSSVATATRIKTHLQASGVTVLDWSEDFAPAGSILTQIEEAAARCTAGIFLFTKDDKIGPDEEAAAPRDNVVFETGFFAHAKGKERVLIVREKGSKMPADLGGDIYASLDDRSDIDPVKPVITRFLQQRL